MAAKQFYLPFPTAFTSNGLAEPGAKLYFYLSGTSTPTPSYTSSALTTQHPHPVVANGAGRFEAVYLNDALTLRLVIKDADGVTLEDLDPFIPGTFYGATGMNGATASNLTIGLFVGAAGQDLTSGGTKPPPEVVFTSGYSEIGKGAAAYILSSTVTADFAAAHPRWTFRDAHGNGYRLAPEEQIHFHAFGGIGDATLTAAGTDNYPAWLAAKDFLHAHRQWPGGNYYYKACPELHFGIGGYEFSEYINKDDAMYRFTGQGPSGSGGTSGGTVFFFAAGKGGIVAQGWDTSGFGDNNAPNINNVPFDHGASEFFMQNIVLVSRGMGDITKHGLLIRCHGGLRNVYVKGFGGHGIAIIANTPGAGNANSFLLEHCGADGNNGDGLYLQGGDANACVSIGFQANANRGYGINDSSFLGNTHIGFHVDGNGTRARCTHAGKNWLVRPGQQVAASTTEPGTNAAVWVDLGAGSGFSAWTSGQTWYPGGSIYCGGFNHSSNNGNRSTFQGYAEQNQPQGWSDSDSAYFAPGFAGWSHGVGASQYAAKGVVASRAVGLRQDVAGDKQVWNALWGDGAGRIRVFGYSSFDDPVWSEFIDTNQHTYFSYNNLANTSPMDMYGPGHVRPYAMGFHRGCYIGAVFVGSGTAAPTTGTWEQGDRILNETAVASGVEGWVCVASGTPGTWKTFGAIGA